MLDFLSIYLFWTAAAENLWAPIQCWLIGLYIWSVSYFLLEIFILFYFIFKKNLFINYEFLVHGFRLCCFSFCMQKMAWIREFLLKFTNFRVKINLISIIYEIFVRFVCVFGSYFGLWLSLGFWLLQMQICIAHFFLQICMHPSLQVTDFTSFSWLDLIL